MNRCHFAAALVAALLTTATAAPARAAESYDNCIAYIDVLPAVIGTQGVWCLRDNLSTAITSGAAITIATNNVTIDCNDFKIGNLAAGPSTNATGIQATNRRNAIVRNCTIRGFRDGIDLYSTDGAGGHIVEDNRIEAATETGLRLYGDGSVARRNTLLDIGGSTLAVPGAYGIYTGGGAVDVQANTIVGVLPANTGNRSAYGIIAFSNSGSDISGNRVRGLLGVGTGVARGIYNGTSGRIAMVDNYVVGDDRAGGIGLACANSLGRSRDNIVADFATGISGCSNDGNVVAP